MSENENKQIFEMKTRQAERTKLLKSRLFSILLLYCLYHGACSMRENFPGEPLKFKALQSINWLFVNGKRRCLDLSREMLMMKHYVLN